MFLNDRQNIVTPIEVVEIGQVMATVAELQLQLEQATAAKKIAEERAQQAEMKLSQEMFLLMSVGPAQEEIRALRIKNRNLLEQLQGCQQKIVSQKRKIEEQDELIQTLRATLRHSQNDYTYRGRGKRHSK